MPPSCRTCAPDEAAGATVSPIHYNPKTLTPELFVKSPDGRNLRIRGEIQPPVFDAASIATKENRMVGSPLASEADGHALLRRLNEGDLDALREVGAEPPDRPIDEAVEWGLGRTPDGQHVLIRGQSAAVDWSAVPGIVALAHTHPRTQTEGLPRDAQGKRRVSVRALLEPTSEPLLARAVVFPSPADIQSVAKEGTPTHTVHTAYELRDGWIAPRGSGEAAGQPLSFAIHGAVQVGVHPQQGVPVYQATLEFLAGEASPDPVTIYALPPKNEGDLGRIDTSSPLSSSAADAAGDVGGRGVGAMRRLEFEPAPYHGRFDNPVKSKGPKNGQAALDNSLQVTDNSTRRVGIDPETREFVVFDETRPGRFHGHVREWSELRPADRSLLRKEFDVSKKGKIPDVF